MRKNMADYRIGVLPGDGTGREVALEAQRILDTIEQNTNCHPVHPYDLHRYDSARSGVRTRSDNEVV